MRRSIHSVILLLLLSSLLVLSGCASEDEPATEQIENETTENVVQAPAPTATANAPQSTSTQSDTDTASTAKQASADQYNHPAGLFNLISFGVEYEEYDSFTFFYQDNDIVIAFVLPEEISLTDDSLATDISGVMEQTALQTGLIDTFDLYLDDAEYTNDGYHVFFDYTSADYGDGEGAIFVKEIGATAGLILLTEAYDYVADNWWTSVDSFNLEAVHDEAVVENTAPNQTETESVADASENTSLVADSGFRPASDGFSFYNYGNDDVSHNLTPAELQRMFGDQVCANTANGACTLTPPANQWLKQINAYMDGGHCEGMAVLSSLLYYDRFETITPDQFGATQTPDLVLSNELLQREIAYWWATQGVYPAANYTINESPQVVLDKLIETFAQGAAAEEVWAVGIYKSDFTGGHAVTPFAVEDKGNGIFHILVYDNNFPGETRAIVVDTNTNSWQYQASINPDVPEELYDGDASLQNLEIVAIYPRMQQQECPFCQDNRQGRLSAGLASAAPEFYEIWLDGDADLLIIDENGKRIGFDNGQFVNEIEGATTLNFKYSGIDVWDADNEPVYRIPVGTTFEIVVDGARMTDLGASDVSLIGPGFFVAVEELWLEPGEADSIFVEVDEQRHHLTYATDYSESPEILVGVETDEADYAFLVQATELTGAEDTFDVAVDLAEGDFIVDTSFNDDTSTYEAYLLRIDDEGEIVFGGPDLVLEPDTTVYLNYLEWQEDGDVIYADFDYNGDGEIDESLELPDEQDYEFFAEDEALEEDEQ